MNAPPVSPPRKRRWLRRLLLAMFTLVVAAVALAPSIVSWNPALRDRLVRKLVGKVKADVVVDSLSAGWFQTLRIGGVRVVPPTGDPLLTIDVIESDRPLWQMVLSPADLGTFRVERPVVNMDLRRSDNNFSRAFRPLRETPKPPLGLQLGAKVRIVDGTFRCRSDESAGPWEIAGVNAGVGWRPASRSPSGKAELLVDRGKLLDHRELSVGLCADLLKFVAPVLANVAEAKGAVTIELDDWRLPWDDFSAGELGGRITMHTVEVGPGALTRSILAQPLIAKFLPQFSTSSFVQLAYESVVPFYMTAGKIHHDNLRFNLANLLDVETHGDVGLNRSLDLMASLGVHPPNPEDRRLAVLRVLTNQAWPVRIVGKLGEPQVDPSPLGNAGVDLVDKTLEDIKAGKPSIGAGVFQALNDRGIPIQPDDVGALMQLLRPSDRGQGAGDGRQGTGGRGQEADKLANPPPLAAPSTSAPYVLPAPKAQASSTVPSGVEIAVDVLEELARRRRERQQAAPPGPPNPNLPPDQQEGPPPRRPLLRRGLNMLLEATNPPPPAPSATGTGPK